MNGRCGQIGSIRSALESLTSVYARLTLLVEDTSQQVLACTAGAPESLRQALTACEGAHGAVAGALDQATAALRGINEQPDPEFDSSALWAR